MTNDRATETTRTEFRILAHNVDRLLADVKKLNRRATKLGLNPILVTLGEAEVEEIRRRDDWTGLETITHKHYRRLTVQGERPVLPGWTFVGRLTHEPGGVMFAAAPGQQIPERYRTEAPDTRCDHCLTRRNRVDTFVLRDNTTGDEKVIGRNCLQDFIGDTDVSGWMATLEIERSIRSLADGDDDDLENYEYTPGSRFRHYMDLESLLAAAACAIRAWGWKPAAYDPPNTVDDTMLLLFPPKSRDRWTDDLPKATEADTETAKATIAWMLSLEGKANLSDYMANLLTIAKTGSVGPRFVGVAVSAVKVYLGAEAKRREAAVTFKNEHFGTLKKRANYRLTLVDVKSFEGDIYGTRHLYKMVDEAGRVAIWWTGKPEGQGGTGMERGKTYEVRATVKAHESYQGMAQTVLSRCDCVAEINQEAATEAAFA